MRRMLVFDDLVDLLTNSGQVFRLRHDIDIEDPPKLIVVDLGGRVDRFDRSDCFERSGVLAIIGTQRDLLKVVQRLYLALRILHREHVVVSRLWVDPIARGDHAVRGHGGDYAVDDGFWRKALKARLLAIDIQCQARDSRCPAE